MDIKGELLDVKSLEMELKYTRESACKGADLNANSLCEIRDS